MTYFLPIIFTSIAVVTQAFRVAQRSESALGNSNQGTCAPVMAVHLCKTSSSGGGGAWSITDRISGLNSEDKKCLSLLCDKKGKTQCCEARDALMLAGVPVEEFKYSEDAVIRKPTPPDEVPGAVVNDFEVPERTTCMKELRLFTFDTFQRSFSLPETKRGGSAEVVCGHGAKEPEAKVTFACGEDLKWTKTSGTCEKDLIVKCPAHVGPHAAKVEMSFMNDGLSHANYYFDLPEQPNAFGQDIDIVVKCPHNARNEAGEATWTCHPSGSWSLKQETCSKPAAGVCYPRAVTLAINEHEMEYQIPEKGVSEKGLTIPYEDGEEVTDVPCNFGKFNQGLASMTCKSGAWVFNHELCHMTGVTAKEERDADAKFCNKMDFKYTLNHVSHVYTLEKDELGAQKQEQCAHGKLTQGEVTFECKEGERGAKWALVSKTCQAPPGSGCGGTKAPLKMTINGEKHEWLFILKETEGPGVYEFPCPDGYTGNAEFECTPENKWSYKRGSAKCVK